MNLKMGELFAGYGGLGMGTHAALSRLGVEVETAWVCEFDEAPSKLLAQHWPDAPNLGDVTKVDFTKVERVDVLTGGFPCQDVSLAGRRAGMGAGTRSGLWSEFARAIDELRPGLVVIENVRGLLSARAGKAHDADLEYCPICVGDGDGSDLRALGAVLGDLAELGFDAEWGLLAASAVGAPHRRERVFIVAWPADSDGDLFRELARRAFAEETGSQEGDGFADSGGGTGFVSLFRTPCAAEAEGGRRNPDREGATMRLSDQVLEEVEAGNLLPTPEAALGVRGGAQDPVRRREGGHSVSLADAVHVLPTPTASAGDKGGPGQRYGSGSLTITSAVAMLPTPKAGDADFGTPRTSGRPPEMSTHLATRIAYRDFGEYALAVERWSGVIGRQAPSPTEVGPKGGARLSSAFVEWMMGVPKGHVVGHGLTRVQELRALGNGVVPQQAAAAVLALLARAWSEVAA
ncbi:DNA (cytosine-5-)-methyltransferase [Gulosibacter macacae]|uniref:DNA (cytosine-5-)-methyltransferase n=1 Tax=Gulosibacter macacae TaxID=2488791 RepID=A0A3P3VT07_9MICO|nr:DNA (cytosine-5-)-methyltransferase [Gulosibacter macacae]RRJ85931.1 DNA (cytosine-5-)-methyltransferase [Gulosibacter macacae]